MSEPRSVPATLEAELSEVAAVCSKIYELLPILEEQRIAAALAKRDHRDRPPSHDDGTE